MLPRLAPFAIVWVAACGPGGGAADLPPAVTPRELVDAALESASEGDDILEAMAEFESAETWRNAPAGVVLTPRALEVILETHDDPAPAEPVAPVTRP